MSEQGCSSAASGPFHVKPLALAPVPREPAWWCRPVFPALWRWRQKKEALYAILSKFKARLGFLSQKHKTKVVEKGVLEPQLKGRGPALNARGTNFNPQSWKGKEASCPQRHLQSKNQCYLWFSNCKVTLPSPFKSQELLLTDHILMTQPQRSSG